MSRLPWNQRKVGNILLTFHNGVWVSQTDGTTFMQDGEVRDRFGINKAPWLVNGQRVAQRSGSMSLEEIVRATYGIKEG